MKLWSHLCPTNERGCRKKRGLIVLRLRNHEGGDRKMEMCDVEGSLHAPCAEKTTLCTNQAGFGDVKISGYHLFYYYTVFYY